MQLLITFNICHGFLWRKIHISIGYKDDGYKIKPFSIILPKMSVCIKRYDGETKWMYFLIEDDKHNIMI